MSYTVTVEVSGQLDKPGGMWTAVAVVEYDAVSIDQKDVIQTFITPSQHSYTRSRAISYALTEAALAFERGEIP